MSTVACNDAAVDTDRRLLTSRDVIIDITDGSAVVVLDDQRIRTLRLGALAMLVVLNVLDLLTTKAFLARGIDEGNPLSDVLLRNGAMPFVKGAVLCALAWRIVRGAPRLGPTCALWFVTGIYTMTITVNLMVLRSL